MQIDLTSEQEAQLTRLAARDGRKPGDLARDAVNRYLGEEARFAAAVESGLAALARGDALSHAKVGRRLEKLLRS